MNFEVTILGCGAATPTSRFNPSAQVVNIHDKLFLVDCGEGTQMQLRRFHIKFQRIQHIFISHLHGDHYLGLLGLISSLNLLGRKAPLTIYGPPHLEELIRLNLQYSDTWLEFPLNVVATSTDGRHMLFEDRTLEVFSFPLKHRIPCTGFLFREKEKERRMIREKLAELRIEPSEIVQLKKGETVVRTDGKIITPDEACFPPDPLRSYAYCSDTAYWETLKEYIEGVDLLYHESTFLESERERAKLTFHSTASQAARIASLVNAEQLLLGHFSSRYSTTDAFLEESTPHFANVLLGKEGETFKVGV